MIIALLGFACAMVSLNSDAKTSAYAPPEQEKMVPVEGGKVYVRINGLEHKSAIPVIFVHGGPGGTHNGFAGMTGLANERMVIMYDQLDSGRSDQPNDPVNWRVERFVDSIDIIRKSLGIERWHVVGHSWGSALALEYSARFPDNTVSTVLGGTFISTPHWIMDANLLVKAAPQEVQNTLKTCESSSPPTGKACNDAYTKLYSVYYERAKPPKAKLDYLNNIGGNGFNPLIYHKMWGPSEFSSTGILKHYDATHLLADVDGSKLLFMIGQYDSARIDTVQNYLALTPGAELAVVPGGAHGFYADRPNEVEALLRGWLQRHDAH